MNQLELNISISPLIIGRVNYSERSHSRREVFEIEINVDDNYVIRWPFCKKTGNFRGLLELKKTGDTQITLSYRASSISLTLNRRILLFRNHIMRPVIFICDEKVSEKYKMEINSACKKLG